MNGGQRLVLRVGKSVASSILGDDVLRGGVGLHVAIFRESIQCSLQRLCGSFVAGGDALGSSHGGSKGVVGCARGHEEVCADGAGADVRKGLLRLGE